MKLYRLAPLGKLKHFPFTYHKTHKEALKSAQDRKIYEFAVTKIHPLDDVSSVRKSEAHHDLAAFINSMCEDVE